MCHPLVMSIARVHESVDLATDLRTVPETARAPERRQSGRRARIRDRLMDRATQPQAGRSLTHVRNVENLMLFVDDDLRETALALTRIEDFLGRTLALLEMPHPRRQDVADVAADISVLDHLDQLNETLESLRRRLATLHANMK